MPIPNPLSDQQIADQLTRDGWHWYGDNGDVVIYYSFSTDLGDFGTGTEYGLNTIQQVWVETALTELSEIFDLNFVETSEPANTSSNYPVDVMQFVNDTGNGTYAQWWSYGNGDTAFANVYFDQTWSSNQSQNLEYGSYGYMTMLHEILHTLGMEHPGEYNAGSGSPITYQNNAEFEQDTHRYSVMSYFNSSEDGSGAIFYDTVDNEWVYPRTPMVYDILAMNSGSFDGLFGGYGFNTTTRDGDTVYGHNASSGMNAAYDFDQYDAPVLTIYDAGGTDTLDLSGDTVTSERYVNYNPDDTIASYGTRTRTETLIDLREGQYSSTHGMTYNIGTAFGSIIENAIGTQFNDTIHGNAVANYLYGGSDGVDILYGYDGADFLDGGVGVDQIFGGLGDDTIVYDANDDWSGGNIDGGEGFDTLLFNMVWTAVDLFTYGFEQSALYLIDAATELWSEIYEYYNLSNQVTQIETLFDDGTSQMIVYDINDTETWSESIETYDANGNLIDEVYVADSVSPTANPNTDSVAEDSEVEPSGNLLTDDNPGSGEPLTLTTINSVTVNSTGETFVAGSYGWLFVQADGSYRYILDNSNSDVDLLNDTETLVDTFNYVAGNSAGTSGADLNITINGATDVAPPTAIANTDSVTEDSEVEPSGNLLTDDNPGSGEPLTLTTINSVTVNSTGETFVAGSYGWLFVQADGSYRYILDNSNSDVDLLNDTETLVDTFNYVAGNSAGTSSADLDITINGATDVAPPTAIANTDSVTEDSEVEPSGNLLTDDNPGSGEPLTLTTINSVTVNSTGETFVAGSYGWLFVQADGSYRYILDNSNSDVDLLNDTETLVDTFNYVAGNSAGTSSADLDITINGATDVAPPTAIANTDSVTEDSEVEVTGNVLGNDDPGSGDPLALESVNSASVAASGETEIIGSYGSLFVQADGSYRYVLDNANSAVDALNDTETLVDTFNYMAGNSAGTSSADLDITINGATDVAPPTAIANTDSVTEDSEVEVTGNVLGNDDPGSGDPLALESVNSASVAASGETEIIGSYGSLFVQADGSYRYVLDNANSAVDALNDNETLIETFNYTTGNSAGTSSADLDITINGATDVAPPTANPNTDSVTEDSGVEATGNVLGDDDPGSGDPLALASVNSASVAASGETEIIGSYGSLFVQADGSYRYVLDNANSAVDALNDNETLIETFNYTTGNSAGTSSADLDITINGATDVAPPTANPNTDSVTEDSEVEVTGNVLGNDDPGSGDPLALESVNSASVAASGETEIIGSYGSLFVQADGSYRYVLDNANSVVDALNDTETLTDTFSYVGGNSAGTSSADLQITVNGTTDPVPPSAAADTGAVTEDSGVETTGNLLTNDDPGSGDPLALESVNSASVAASGETEIIGSYGSLFVQADGSYRYVLDNANSVVDALNDTETLTDTFSYVGGNSAGTSSADLQITVNGTTDPVPPSAAADTGAVTEDSGVETTGNLLTNDDPGSGDPLTLASVNTVNVAAAGETEIIGSYGSLFVQADGSYRYVLDDTNSVVDALDDTETLTDTFSYVGGNSAGTSSADLDITINGATDVAPPTANPNTDSVTEDSGVEVTGNVLGNDDPGSGDPLALASVNSASVAASGETEIIGSYGSLFVQADGSYRYVLDNTNSVVDALNETETLTETFSYVGANSHGSSGSDLEITIDGYTDFTNRNTYNNDGELVKYEVLYDDGSRHVYYYDPDNLEAWAQRDSKADANGQLVTYTLNWDDGSMTRYVYDPDNLQTYSRRDSTTDVNGNLLTYVLNWDDGSMTRYVYDPDNLQTYSRRDSTTDVNGNLLTYVLNWDDGSMTRYVYDPDNLQTYSRRDSTADVNGNLLTYILNWDDGSKTKYDYDPDDQFLWHQVKNEIASTGEVQSETVYFDDASRKLTEFDLEDQFTWDQWVREYDTAGTLVDEYYL